MKLFFGLAFASFTQLCSAADSFQNVNELLDFVESRSPEIQKARSRLDVIRARRIQAGQVPNPEVSLGKWSGKAGNQNWNQTDVTIAQPIELGGKRGSRIDVAQAEFKASEVELATLSAQTRLQILFSLYRLRQLGDEISSLEEARHTFANLTKIYRKRPQLSPEQTTSVLVFSLTERQYENLLQEAQGELNFLKSDFQFTTNLNADDYSRLLPKRLKKWPSLNDSGTINSPMLRLLNAQSELSEKELQLAKSEVWPTVSIGPSFTSQSQFGERADVLGFVVSLPLPILNQNQGGREIATRNLNAARKFIEVERRLIDLRRLALLKSYESSSSVLEGQWDQESFKQGHRRLEQNFLRGLLSSTLVIEAHRQYVESQKLFHTRELKTLDYYFQYLLLEGGRIGEIPL